MNELLRRADAIPVTLVCVIAYVTLAFVTDPMSPTSAQLVAYGASRGIDVADGQAWRLVTYAFLHGGALHLALNLHALLTLGPMIELSLGSVRFAVLYIVGAIGGGIAGCMWHHPLAPLVGGSGALFAMLGSEIALLARSGGNLADFARSNAGRQALANTAIQFVFGLAIPRVSNAGHFGGLVAGFCVTYWFLTAPRHAAPGLLRARVTLAALFVGAIVAVARPVTNREFLVLQWGQTPPGAHRDAVRDAFALTVAGDFAPGTDTSAFEDVLGELYTDLQRARRFE